MNLNYFIIFVPRILAFFEYFEIKELKASSKHLLTSGESNTVAIKKA